MQMFIWTGPNPDRSGDLDQDVIFHEATHGLSNRLHGNATGLIDNMARGMGEGWSDFYARSLLATADEDANGIYTIGGWATHLAAAGYTDNYYHGIRRFPYAPRSVTGGPLNRPHSPLTFADVDSTQFNAGDGAFPRGPFGVATVDQAHNLGEIWAGMLWEVRSRFIARQGFAGNQELLQYVTDGMKLSPLNPNFLQARDAILDAAEAGGGTPEDIDDIWAGFAARGLGALAQILNEGTGTNNTRVVESFQTPDDPVPAFSINDVSVVETNAGTTTAAFTVSLTNPSATESRVSFQTADGTASSLPGGPSTTFQNSSTITVPASGTGTPTGAPAAPYPIGVVVSGYTDVVKRVEVRLNAVTHTFPDDMDILLVGPLGQKVMLMSDAGGGGDIAGVNLTFRDGAIQIPNETTLTTGTFAPADHTAGESLVAPAPAAPYGTQLSVFNGLNPNGTWNLYVQDDATVDVGTIAGFAIILTTGPTDYDSASQQLIFPPGTTSLPVNITINGDVTVEPNETFVVNLSAPVNAIITDDVGQGTILNDDGGSLPTSANDAYSTAFNTALTVAAPGILANDNSNGGGALTALLFSNVSNGALTMAAGGNFTYTPNAGFSGIDSFMYRAVNGNGAGPLATATITVQPPAPPTSLDDAYNTPFNMALTVPAPGALGNDSSNGGGAMTASLMTNAVNGVLAFNANGGFTYTPKPGFVGTDSFTYLATNSVGAGNVATVLLTVAAPTTIQPPIGLYVSSMEGNLVTFRWRPFPFGPQPTGHVIEGGVNPGEVLGSLPTDSPYPIFTVSVPTGSFFIRMHALDGSDRSGASNEIQIFVNVPQTPSSPADLVGVANGGTVGLAWRNTFAGGAPSTLVLDVTGSQTGSLPLGMTDNFNFAGIPGGTYTFTVRETNDTGTSAQSNAVTMTFPSACSGAPFAPSNFLAYKIGNTVYLVWDPPVSGAAPTGYIVNVTGSFAGSFPTTGRSLSGAAPPGTYTFTVTGVNDCGSATTSEQTVTIP